jgi:hypothetical protein
VTWLYCSRVYWTYCCNGVGLCLNGTMAADGPNVHTPDDTWVNMEQRWNDIDGDQRTQTKICPTATLSTKSPTWTDLGLNLGCCSEKLVTNCHCMACTAFSTGINVFSVFSSLSYYQSEGYKISYFYFFNCFIIITYIYIHTCFVNLYQISFSLLCQNLICEPLFKVAETSCSYECHQFLDMK